MRTSYTRSKGMDQKPEPKKPEVQHMEDNIDLEKEAIRVSLRDAYLSIESSLVERREKDRINEYTEALSNQADSFIDDRETSPDEDYFNAKGNTQDEVAEEGTEEVEEKPKRNKKLIVTLSVVAAVVVAVVGLFIYKSFFAPDSSVEAIQTRISKLYTSEDRVDIKDGVTQQDLSDFYMELLDVQDKGDNIDSAVEEVDTIGYFISDKANLERYSSETYDLTTAGMMDSIEDIKENAKKYTVPGLALTITDMAKVVEDDYNYFIDLRTELNGVVDVLSFDESGYEDKINAVSHIPNRTELEATYEKILVDKQAAEAQQTLQDARDEQARQEAQQALEEAQELQRQTQEELEATKKQLEEAAKKAAEEEQERQTIDAIPITPEATSTPTPTVTVAPTESAEEQSLEDTVETMSNSVSEE